MDRETKRFCESGQSQPTDTKLDEDDADEPVAVITPSLLMLALLKVGSPSVNLPSFCFTARAEVPLPSKLTDTQRPV